MTEPKPDVSQLTLMVLVGVYFAAWLVAVILSITCSRLTNPPARLVRARNIMRPFSLVLLVVVVVWVVVERGGE